MAIIVIGPTYMDCTIRLPTLPSAFSRLDTSIEAENMEWLPGGTGLSYAVALSHLLNERIKLVTCIGIGHFSEYLKGFAEEHGVEIISQEFDNDADIALVLITSDGGKLALSYRKITSMFKLHHRLFENLKQNDVIVVTSFPAPVVAELLENVPNIVTVMLAPNMRLCRDGAVYADLLPKANIVAASEREILELSEQVGKSLKCVDTIIETMGDRGHRIYRRFGEVKSYPAYRRIERPFDTNGAGEAFGAAFLAARLCGLDDSTASKMASFYAAEHISNRNRLNHLFPKYTVWELLEKALIL